MKENNNLVGNIDLKKIEAYKNIRKSLKDITSSYFFRGYNLQIDELKDIVQKRNIEILKNFTEDEKRLLVELIKYTKNEEYNKYFVENFKVESKKKVLNYMYWQYKLIDTSIKIDLINLKRLLGIKSAEKYIESVKISTICNICGMKASILVKSYNKEDDISFECNNCRHEEIRDKENIFPIKCKCPKCNKLNESFFFTVKSNFERLIDGIKQQTEEFYNSSNEEMYLVDDEEMEIDYRLNRCDFDKDVREVMSYRPKDIQELIKIIRKLEQRNKGYDRNYKSKIYNKLDKLKIIYLITVKEDLEAVKEDVIDTFIRARCEHEGERYIDNILLFLKNCESIDKFERTVEYWNSNRIVFNIKNNQFEFFLNGNFNCAPNYNPIIKQTLIFNKFYAHNDNFSNIIGNKTNLKNIFKSEKEKSLYRNLSNRYPRSIVLPNYKAYNIIDIISIKNALSEEEYQYSNKCYFDFVICNSEGNPIKVIELQRGEHHNEKEWIEKDNMKQRICEVAGIEFEEIY